MKVLAIASPAALALSGLSSASGGWLTTCINANIQGLEGDYGRDLIMQADCRDLAQNYKTSTLDLNTCLGWDSNCEFK